MKEMWLLSWKTNLGWWFCAREGESVLKKLWVLTLGESIAELCKIAGSALWSFHSGFAGAQAVALKTAEEDWAWLWWSVQEWLGAHWWPLPREAWVLVCCSQCIQRLLCHSAHPQHPELVHFLSFPLASGHLQGSVPGSSLCVFRDVSPQATRTSPLRLLVSKMIPRLVITSQNSLLFPATFSNFPLPWTCSPATFLHAWKCLLRYLPMK